MDTTDFHTIIVSRNINFLTEFNNIKCFQLILSLHDTYILSRNNDSNNILDIYNSSIDKVITLTPWHKSNISKIYNEIYSKQEVMPLLNDCIGEFMLKTEMNIKLFDNKDTMEEKELISDLERIKEVFKGLGEATKGLKDIMNKALEKLT